MYLSKKLKEHGFVWFLRRIMREFVRPTTTMGKYLKPLSALMLYAINKPIHFWCTAINSESTPTNDCLYFFYDFDVEPVTYDFALALCIANAKRITLGLSHLKVVFVPGRIQGLRKEELEYEAIVNQEARSWRIYSILLPMVRLLPCSYGFTICMSREEAQLIGKVQARFVYPDHYNVTFPIPYSPKHSMKYPKELMAFKADEQALTYVSHWLNQRGHGRKLIVITLRQYNYTPARNSNMAAWAQFSVALDQAEYFVVFIPDTEQALLEIPNALKAFTFFKPACWNLLLRSALYELAYLNLGVNTGPMSLCWFNPLCRYITFKTITENGVQASRSVMTDRGFVFGKSPIFAGPLQKWVWDEDSFDIVMKEFMLMCAAIETSKEC